MGNGTYKISSAPVQVSGLTSGVIAISVGRRHTCAIHNGGAKCWGYNYLGQLGDGETGAFTFPRSSAVPIPVSGLLNGVTAISAGYDHSCAIVNGATIRCWSRHRSHTGCRDSFIRSCAARGTVFDPWYSTISGLSEPIIDISVNSSRACAVVSKQLYCWDQSGAASHSITAPTDPVDFSAGSSSSGARGLVGPSPAPRKIILAD